MTEFNLILLEPILIVLGVVALAIWQFRDLAKAREQTRQRRLREAQHAADAAGAREPASASDSAAPPAAGR